MSSRSSTSSSSLRRSLALGLALLVGAHVAVHATRLAPLALWGGENWARKEVRLERLERTEPVEVLAFGSSHMDFGFDARRFTELTGRSAFNLGLPGTDAYFQALALRHLLIPRHRPKVILWSLRDTNRSRSAINHQYLEAPALRHAMALGERLARLETWMLYPQRRKPLEWWRTLFAAARPLNERGDPIQLARATGAPGPDGQGDEGAEADEAEDGARGELTRRANARATFEVSERVARETIEDTLRFARDQGIEVFVVLTPFSRELYETDYGLTPLGGGVGGFNAWLDEALRRQGVALVNLRYSPEISDDPALFYDTNHLNRAGAARLTELLAPIVQGEPVPARWRATPSADERDLLLGPIDRERLPLFPVGERIPLERAVAAPDRRGQEGLLARVEVRTAGTYHLQLLGSPRATRTGSYFVRIGGGGFHGLQLQRAPGEDLVAPAEFHLDPGIHEVELRREAGDPVDWNAFGVF